jgi:hypothetical protein
LFHNVVIATFSVNNYSMYPVLVKIPLGGVIFEPGNLTMKACDRPVSAPGNETPRKPQRVARKEVPEERAS